MSARIMRKFHDAINVATKSTMLEQHGAVIVRGGKTMAMACNSLQPTHNRAIGNWQHAEVAALFQYQRCKTRVKQCPFSKSYRERVKEPDRVWLRCLCCPYQERPEWEYPHIEL